jgi:hypothetical protein
MDVGERYIAYASLDRAEPRMSHDGPVATDSLERRGTLTSVSAKEPVPQPDTNYTDQNWDPGGHRIFIRDNHLYGAVVASMNGVGDGHGDDSRADLDSHVNMPVVWYWCSCPCGPQQNLRS